MNQEIKQFQKQLSNWGKGKLPKVLNKELRTVSLQSLKLVMVKSPVDEGTFRGNWNVGVNKINVSVDTDYTSNTNKKKIDTVKFNEGSNRIGSLKIGDTINISNSLPYSTRIEYGWSDQAPSGVVRLTLIELTDWLKKKNGKL